MTEDEVKMTWVYCGERWATFTIPESEALRGVKMLAWMDTLGDLDARLVRAAMVSLGPRDFPPDVGLLRREALSLMRAERGETPVPDADEAWGEVRRAFGSHGRLREPEWSHPAVASVVASMGWRELCASTEEGVVRGQFTRLYREAAERISRQQEPPPPALAAIYREGALAGIKRADDAIGAGSE